VPSTPSPPRRADGIGVDAGDQAGDCRRAPGNQRQQGLDERLGDAHPPLEAEVTVRLGQDGNPVAESHPVGHESRPRIERAPRRRAGVWTMAFAVECVFGDEVAVRVGAPAPIQQQPAGIGQQRARHLHETRVGVDGERRRVGQVIAVVRPVGGVQVDDHVRVPDAKQRGKRPALGRLQLHEIAVQIGAAGVGAYADAADGAVLVGPVLAAHALVAVGVVERGNEHGDPVEEPAQVAAGQPPRQDQRRFLAFDLAAMDAAQHQDPRLASGTRHGGGRRHGVAEDRQRQGPALLARAKCLDARQRGRGLAHRLEHVADVVVPARLLESRLLGSRACIGRLGPSRDRAAHEEDQEGKSDRPHYG
jgi:hypothetical protein